MGKTVQFALAFFMAWSGTTLADAFAPNKLTLSAPQYVRYQFDGARIKIPVTIGGAAADVVLCVLPKDEDHGIRAIRNGHLGWHYVNQIDTCLYMSAPHHYQPGENTIEWSGRDENGNILKFNSFVTYYLWGYDSAGSGEEVTKAIQFHRFDRAYMHTADSNGKPLDRPVLYDAPQVLSASGPTRIIRTKWIIGSDPGNSSLAETTAYQSWNENSPLALDPTDDTMFFTQAVRPDGQFVLQKYQWAPNGDAILQTDWGNDWILSGLARPFQNSLYSGLVCEGEHYLLYTGIDTLENPVKSYLHFVDITDGSEIKRLNLTPWWSDASGQPTGPAAITFASGCLFLNSPFSCLAMMANPYYEDESQFVVWTNGNGDFIGDKNYEPDSRNPWACNDFSIPPFAGALSADKFRFSVFPIQDINAASFGVFAPDGTGVGYFPIPGMQNGKVHGMHIVDTGSPYDGLYSGGVRADDDSTGVWYRGYASARGMIGIHQDFWGPFIMVREPVQGDCLIPGTQQRIYWISNGISSVRIDLSTDSGATWTIVEDNITNTDSYLWTVPAVNSENCIIRVAGREYSTLSDVSYPFSITGPSAVADDDVPRPFVTVSNRPNPFNPSTVIHYELGLPGRVTLTVYNAVGQQVLRYDLGQKVRGAHEYRFDGSGLTSGVYFYRVETENASAAGKMLLMR